jgi:hypothetical protein
MSQTIHITQVDAAPIAKVAFPDYRGPQHQVRVSGTYSIGSTELCWSEGSKTEVVVLRAAGGGWQRHELTALSPWDGSVWAGRIPPDCIVVERRTFCGKCMGLTYNVSPDSQFIAGLRLPEAPALTDDEAVVLDGLCGLKSSYRQEAYREAGLNAARVAAAVDALVSRGLAKRNRAGAVSAAVAIEASAFCVEVHTSTKPSGLIHAVQVIGSIVAWLR